MSLSSMWTTSGNFSCVRCMQGPLILGQKMTSCCTKSKLMNHTNPWHLSGSILAVHSPLMLLSHFVSANRPWLISFRTCLLLFFAQMYMACIQAGLKEFCSTILHKMCFCVHSHSNVEMEYFLRTVWFSGSKLEHAALLLFGYLFTTEANCSSTLPFWRIFFKTNTSNTNTMFWNTSGVWQQEERTIQKRKCCVSGSWQMQLKLRVGQSWLCSYWTHCF